MIGKFPDPTTDMVPWVDEDWQTTPSGPAFFRRNGRLLIEFAENFSKMISHSSVAVVRGVNVIRR